MNRIKFPQEHEVLVAPGDMVFRHGLWRSSIACGIGTLILAACLIGPSLALWFG